MGSNIVLCAILFHVANRKVHQRLDLGASGIVTSCSCMTNPQRLRKQVVPDLTKSGVKRWLLDKWHAVLIYGVLSIKMEKSSLYLSRINAQQRVHGMQEAGRLLFPIDLSSSGQGV
jgi:hypothetical protein